MEKKEILAYEYAQGQCEKDCKFKQSGCEQACGEFNICRLDFLAGYSAAENQIAQFIHKTIKNESINKTNSNNYPVAGDS